MMISKIWAHAWIDYMFYDTDLYYSFLKNKNYELPDPPVDYAFKTTSSDPQLPVNLHHAFIVRAFHTRHAVSNSFGLLKDRDWRLMQKVLTGNISDSLLAMVDNQNKKMILKIIDNPQHWKEWLQLFDDENIFEETLFSEDRRESNAQSMNVTYEKCSDRPSMQDQFEEMIEEGRYKSKENSHNFPFDITWREKLPDELDNPPKKLGHKFVLEATPSEQVELESTTKHQMFKKSIGSQLRIDETLITDLDSQIFSPRVPPSSLGGMSTLTPMSGHARAFSESKLSNPILLDPSMAFKSARHHRKH